MHTPPAGNAHPDCILHMFAHIWPSGRGSTIPQTKRVAKIAHPFLPYSDLRFSTGFVRAALTESKKTVAHANTAIPIDASVNTFQLSGIR